jgi:flagellin-like protein
MKNKKAVSGIITTVILIALTLAIIGIIWVVINNLVKEQITSTESCFEVFDKVKLNEMYTCWNSSAPGLQFSISLEDIDVDEILVAISSRGATSSFRISNIPTNISNVKNYPDYTEEIKLPGKNSGLTYFHSGVSSSPDSIEIAPVINGEQCGISSSLYTIENCYS